MQEQKESYFVQGSWSIDMESHAKNVRSDVVSWRTKRLNNSAKLQFHALMTIYSTNTNWELLENCEKIYSPIVLTCLYLARFGRPDIPWSVIKFARAVTKSTRGCDKRLVRLISYIHHTHFKQQCHVGHTAQQCRLGLFQNSFLEILKTQNRPQWNLVYVRKSHVCCHKLDVQKSNFCFAQFNGI